MYHQPTTLTEALKNAQIKDVRILAGGTDFYPSHGDGLPDFPILDISRVADFGRISRTDWGWRLGALTCWSDVAQATLPAAFDGLKAAAREVGSVQIQNVATVAGNLCNASPAADGVPALLTLDAEVELVSHKGVRRLPLEQFLLGVRKTALAEGEILAAVHVPDAQGALGGFSKLGSRTYLVISIAMVAVLVAVEDGAIVRARVAVGACSPVAQRLYDLEVELTGCRDVRDVVRPDHLECLAPIDDVRGSAAYRLDVVAPLIERAISTLLEGV